MEGTGTGYVNQGAAVRLDRPGRDTVVDLSGPAPLTVTFGELDARAAALAAHLARRHPRGTAVGILGENSLPWLTSFLAVQRAGLVAVPISYRQPAELVRYVVEDAELTEVLSDAAHRHLLEGTGAAVTGLDEAWAAGEDAPAQPPVEVDPEEPAMVLYTSGSTGRPKGVVLSHRSHLWVVGRGIEGDSRDSRLLISAPMYHMGALSPVQRALGAGQSVVLLPRFDVQRVLEAIARHRITDLNGVPPMIAMLLQELRSGDVAADLSSVRTVILNSAPAGKELLAELDEVFGHPRFVFTYGTTESGPIAFTAPADGRPVPLGSVGVPHPDVDVRLVREDGTAAGPAGPEIGVLQIRTGALMSGYHRRPDITSPLTADGYYHTKDLFRRDADGFYSFVGREDDMFVSGGENLYPRAIELALEKHPDVAQAAVVPVPDAVKGTKPVAFVVRAPGGTADEAELRRYSLTKLEPAAHPRRIWFVDALPLSATNKIDKRPLEERARRETARIPGDETETRR